MNWQGSAHASNDIACTNCHTLHVKKDPVLVKGTQPEKCFTCHAQQRAQSFLYSHHPVREGKVACSDCHNVHGSPAEAQLKEWSANETCFNCHAEKRGPFAFEHEPVRESCMNCHSPHGSTQANLLNERMPYLCQTCHDVSHQSYPQSATLLPGSNAYNPIRNSTNTANLGLPGTTGAINMVGRSCANCHTQVHGSNAIGGNNLLR
jgi:DmsE family decaheme c-type cytochrome